MVFCCLLRFSCEDFIESLGSKGFKGKELVRDYALVRIR